MVGFDVPTFLTSELAQDLATKRAMECFIFPMSAADLLALNRCERSHIAAALRADLEALERIVPRCHSDPITAPAL